MTSHTAEKANADMLRCSYCARPKAAAEVMCSVHWVQFRRWMRRNLWERWMLWRTGTGQERVALMMAWRRDHQRLQRS